jgi:hypothetical protein
LMGLLAMRSRLSRRRSRTAEEVSPAGLHLADWQFEREDRALADFRLDLELEVEEFDQLPDDAQTQAIIGTDVGSCARIRQRPAWPAASLR